MRTTTQQSHNIHTANAETAGDFLLFGTLTICVCVPIIREAWRKQAARWTPRPKRRRGTVPSALAIEVRNRMVRG